MSIRTKLILLLSVIFLLFMSINNVLLFINFGLIIDKIITQNLEKTVTYTTGSISTYLTNLADNRENVVNAYIIAVADEMYSRVEQLYAQYTQGTTSYNTMYRAVEEYILSSRVLNSGYSFGMNSRGILTIHYTSKGENLKGSPHIDEIIANKNGTIHYTAVTTGMEKVASFRYFEPLDLYLVPGIDSKELEWLHDTNTDGNFLVNLQEKIRLTRIGNEGGVYILDTAGKAIATPDSPYDDLAEELTSIQETYTQHSPTAPFKWKDYTLYVNLLTDNNWLVVGFIPDTEKITYETNMAIMGILVLAASLLLLTISIIITTTRFLKPITKIGNELIQIASGQGDLTRHLSIKQKNEIGILADNFNLFVDKLNGDLVAIDTATTRFAVFATDISSSSQRLAEDSSLQAEKINNILSEVDDFKKDLNAIANHTGALFEVVNASTSTLGTFQQENEESIMKIGQLEKKIEKARSETDTGQEHINATVDLTNRLHANMRQIKEVIHLINEQTTKIENMLQVINDITEQTHILAINASIEAANSGSAGRGFTVISEEIRKLSANTGSSVEQVRSFLRQTRSGMQAVTSISATWATEADKLKISTEISKTSFLALSETMEQIEKIMTGVSEIIGSQNSAATKALTSAHDLEKYSRSITASLTNQTNGYKRLADFVHEMASKAVINARSAKILSQLGSNLKIGEYELIRIIKRFKLNRRGTSSSEQRAAERIDLIYFIEILSGDSKQQLGHISNISRDGFKFLTNNIYKKDETLDIILSPPVIRIGEQTTGIKMKIRIAWQEISREHESQILKQTGCRIVSIGAKERKELDKLVESIFANDPNNLKAKLEEI